MKTLFHWLPPPAPFTAEQIQSSLFSHLCFAYCVPEALWPRHRLLTLPSQPFISACWHAQLSDTQISPRLDRLPFLPFRMQGSRKDFTLSLISPVFGELMESCSLWTTLRNLLFSPVSLGTPLAVPNSKFCVAYGSWYSLTLCLAWESPLSLLNSGRWAGCHKHMEVPDAQGLACFIAIGSFSSPSVTHCGLQLPWGPEVSLQARFPHSCVWQSVGSCLFLEPDLWGAGIFPQSVTTGLECMLGRVWRSCSKITELKLEIIQNSEMQNFNSILKFQASLLHCIIAAFYGYRKVSFKPTNC